MLNKIKFKVDTNKSYWIWLVGFWVGTIIATITPKFPYWEFNIFWLGAHTGFWVKRHYKNKIEDGKYFENEENI